MNFEEENNELNESIETTSENEETSETSETSDISESEENFEQVKPRKKKTFLWILLILILIIILGLAGIYFYYTSALKPISEEKKEIIVTIEKGSSVSDIAQTLEDAGLIQNSMVFRFFVKQAGENNMQAGTYQLYTNMSTEEIFNALNEGSKYYPDLLNITFIEGKNMRWIAKRIESTTNNSYDSVFEVLEDETYIDSLIEKYWFLTDEIKNDAIYYPLEGYLFPDTYNFKNKDVTVQTIFETMLNQMDKKLTPYRAEIEESDYTVHEILTLASVIDSEGANKDSRALIASVFYNRLDSNMSLGSDVTTYYAIKVDMSERDLYRSEINRYNPYNTRGPNMNGKLPIGPIAGSSLESIVAAIEPAESDYLFFVADKNGKVYFTKTNEEHNQKINELKSQGLWFTYDN